MIFQWKINKLMAKQPEHELMALKHPVTTCHLIKSHHVKCTRETLFIKKKMSTIVKVGNLHVSKVLVVEC